MPNRTLASRLSSLAEKYILAAKTKVEEQADARLMLFYCL